MTESNDFRTNVLLASIPDNTTLQDSLHDLIVPSKRNFPDLSAQVNLGMNSN
jgi:hypothetical protein